MEEDEEEEVDDDDDVIVWDMTMIMMMLLVSDKHWTLDSVGKLVDDSYGNKHVVDERHCECYFHRKHRYGAGDRRLRHF